MDMIEQDEETGEMIADMARETAGLTTDGVSPSKLFDMSLGDLDDVDDDEEMANRLAGMGIEAGGWEHELKRQAHEGVPVAHLLPAATRMREAVQEQAACLSGKKLYSVNLRFSRILAEDRDEAIEEAEAGYGHLIERRAWEVFDPNADEEADEVRRTDQPPSKLQIPPEPAPPSIDRVLFFLELDQACVDPLSGEAVLPDYVMISQELYEGLATDPTGCAVPPDDEIMCFEFPVRVVPHTELRRISGTEAHLLAFDRRRTLEEPVEAWEGAEARWEAAVGASVEA